jgi:hypothetical protein
MAFPFVLVKVFSSPTDSKNSFYLIAILFTHALIFIFWYVANKLEIQIYNQSIAYKTLFHFKEMYWEEIIDVDLDFAFTMHHADTRWIFTSVKKSMSISSSYFSKKDNRFLAEAVVAKCSSARISASIKKMAEGKFPWYVL